MRRLVQLIQCVVSGDPEQPRPKLASAVADLCPRSFDSYPRGIFRAMVLEVTLAKPDEWRTIARDQFRKGRFISLLGSGEERCIGGRFHGRPVNILSIIPSKSCGAE